MLNTLKDKDRVVDTIIPLLAHLRGPADSRGDYSMSYCVGITVE
jgi:hypothetical protein